MEGIVILRPPPPLEILIKLHTFLYIFWPYRTLYPPPPQEIPIPSVRGVWIFSGTAQHDIISISQNYYIK